MKSKRIYFILVVLVILTSSSFLLYQKCTFRHIVTEELIIFNPFSLGNNGYQELSSKLKNASSDAEKKEICSSLLKYKNSYNEEQFEKMFTDGNGLYGYKIRKALDYANCYQIQNDIEKAMQVLSPLMNNVVGRDYPLKDKYFELAVELYGKEKVINAIDEGLDSILVIDCNYCFDRCYPLFNTQIGIISEYSTEVKSAEYYRKLVEHEGYFKKLSD